MPNKVVLSKPDPLEVAWAAGFWDGEGTCCLHTGIKSGVYIRMSMTNSNLAALQRFQRVVQVGSIYKQKHYVEKNRKPTWQWQAYQYDEILLVIELLWPFLCDEKQDQMLTAVAGAKVPTQQRREVSYA